MALRNPGLRVVPNTAGEQPAKLSSATPITSAGGEHLLVLSRDQQLIDTLATVAFPHTVHPIEREVDLVASLTAEEAAVILLDAAAVTTPIQQLAEGVKSQFPDVVMIVAGGPTDQIALSTQITDGTVYRFLARPVSPQRIKLFLDAAWRRRSQQTTDFEREPRRLVAGAPTSVPRRTGSGRNTWLIVAIVAAALSTGSLIALKIGTTPPATGATQNSIATLGSAKGGSLESALERGESALGQGELDGAAEYYREAQRINPSDPRVMAGVNKVVQKILAAANAQLHDGHIEQAEQLTRQASMLHPDDPQVAQMLAQFAELRERTATPSAPAAAPAPAAPAVAKAGPVAPQADRSKPSGKLMEYLRRAQDRMHQGSLLDPPDNSARYFITQARSLAPNDPVVSQVERQLLEQVTGEAQKALTANRPDEAERWIAAAAELGARPNEVASLTREVQRDRAAAKADEAVSLFNERLRQGQILDPTDDSAKSYLAQLIRNGPNKPSAQLALQLFQARLLAEAQGAIRHQNYTSARRWLAEAQEAHTDAASLAPIERDLQTAQAQAGDAAHPPAAASVPPRPQQVQLVQTHYVKPSLYIEPGRILPKKGIVDLQFTVRANGATTDVKVISADPPGFFDWAAIEAVRQWRYQPPVQADGHPTQVQTQVRLIFEP
jgi:protein TonB